MKRIIKSENLDENRRTMVKFENVKNAFKLIFHSNLIEMGDFDKNCYQIVNLLTRAYGEIAFFVEKKPFSCLLSMIIWREECHFSMKILDILTKNIVMYQFQGFFDWNKIEFDQFIR